MKLSFLNFISFMIKWSIITDLSELVKAH